MKSNGNEIEKTIVAKAQELGASLAGIASVEDLKASPSYKIYDKRPFYEEYKGVKWRTEHKSVLVWALVHPASEPVLDWWSMKVPGFTPGNGVMRLQSKKLRIWLGEELGILMFTERGRQKLLKCAERFFGNPGNLGLNWEHLINQYVVDNSMAAWYEPSDKWVEIDTAEDIQKAREPVYPRITDKSRQK